MPQKTLAIAESCTGGLLGSLLTRVPGSSRYFLGGVIAYSNRAKSTLLAVSHGVLKKEGAVSEAAARQMARNVRKRLGADVGLAITGIAGPGGGTKEKPVGLVYIALSRTSGTSCKRLLLKGTRSSIRSQAARKALRWIKRVLF